MPDPHPILVTSDGGSSGQVQVGTTAAPVTVSSPFLLRRTDTQYSAGNQAEPRASPLTGPGARSGQARASARGMPVGRRPWRRATSESAGIWPGSVPRSTIRLASSTKTTRGR